MIYSQGHTSSSTRMVGASIAVITVALVGWGLANGIGRQVVERIVPTVTELVTITPEPEIIKPEPQPAVEPDVPVPEEKIIVETPDVELPPIETAPVAEFVEEPVVAVPSEIPPQPSAGPASTSPSLRRASEPPYPAASIRAEEQGVTTLSLCIDTGGRVTSANVASSSGSPRLDEAALKWIKAERFKPASANGVPVQTCSHSIAYEWKLTGR